MSSSSLEALLGLQLRALGVQPPTREWKFGASLGRRWRFDMAWLPQFLAVEIAGGTWMPESHHTDGQGFEDDCEKQAAAVLLGWRIITLTGKQVETGVGAFWIAQAVRGGEVDAEMFKLRRKPSPIGLRALRVPRGKLQTMNLQQFKTGKGARALPERVRKAAGLA